MLSASVELVLSSTASVVVVLSSTASVVVVSESPQAAKPIAITSPNATRHKTNFFIPIAPSYRLLSPTQILIKVPTSRHDNHMPVSSLHLPNTAPVRLPGRTRRSTKVMSTCRPLAVWATKTLLSQQRRSPSYPKPTRPPLHLLSYSSLPGAFST